jgi:hypothetical protein
VELSLLKCSGKTPEATMASALYTDVKRKLSKSVFTRYTVVLLVFDVNTIKIILALLT